MATIDIHSPLQKREAALVGGMFSKYRSSQYELYSYCSDYFWSRYRGVFYVEEEAATEIFQNTFIKFWENIEDRKIYAEDDVVKGKDGEPLKGSIRTYFMGIAKIKYLEYVREHPFLADSDTEMGRKMTEDGFNARDYIDMLYDYSDNVMLEIISDIISHMSPRCNELLTKFYYEEKNLDSILLEIPSIGTKDALKTKKYKCMDTLRKSAKEIYHRYLNS